MAAATTMMAYPVRAGFTASYPQQYPVYPTQASPSHVNLAPPMNGNHYAPYATRQPQQQQQQHPQPSHHHHPASRPSTQPVASPASSEDGAKPSLPSISNLLGIAGRQVPYDNEAAAATATVTAPPPLASHHDRVSSQQPLESSQTTLRSSPPSAQLAEFEQRSRGSYPTHEVATSPHSAIPHPPIRNDSVLEATQSPLTISTGSNFGRPPHFTGSAINQIQPTEQQRAAQAQMEKRHSVPSQPNVSPYEHPRYTTSPHATSPATMSAPPYLAQVEPAYQLGSGLYHQRPLPSNFPPAAPMSAQSTPGLPTSNPWEHHHYISSSSQATYPQSQDRYICPTCNKAFSRPSSLKIHSHSHTGEKPFRCPHSGCGKAFSVRSNMKRHERGCHSGMPAATLPPHVHAHHLHHRII